MTQVIIRGILGVCWVLLLLLQVWVLGQQSALSVIEGSSQEAIGSNVTSKCYTIHSNGNYPKVSNAVGIPLENINLHLQLPSTPFFRKKSLNCSNVQAKLFCATEWLNCPEKQRPQH